MTPRYSTRRRPAPVKIGLAQASELGKQLQGDNSFPRGAGTFATRRGVSASVGPKLVIRPERGVNDQLGRKGVKTAAKGRRKKGYPPLVRGE